MHEHVKIGKAIYKIPGRLGYFDKTPPMDGAIEGFKALQRHGHEVLVCSSPYNPDSARAKQEWCARYLGTRWSDVTLTHKKHWMNADVIIDDKPETIVEFSKLGRAVVTIAYPYNECVTSHCNLRALDMNHSGDAWTEIVEYLT
jgi:5'(3')-deoxyribonucleotidase